MKIKKNEKPIRMIAIKQYKTLIINTIIVENKSGRYGIEVRKSVVDCTGDAVLADIVCANIDTNGDTGDIAVDNLDATASASFTRSTGDVNINNVKTGGDLNIAVSTGESTLTNVSCTSFITVGDTGDVLMSKLIATGKIDIVRSTGDVDFEDCDAAEIRIQTSTGNVKGNWLTEKVFIVRSNTGKISVPETTSGGKCKIETDTGDIVISTEK